MRRELALLLLIAAACAFPDDPEDTLELVRDRAMRVGVVENPPWVSLAGDAPTGIEVALIHAFARELHADVRWVEGSEDELLTALEHGALHVVIGGLTTDSAWIAKIGATRPYHTARLVVAAPPGHPPVEDLEGRRVVVERGSIAEALLRERDARPVPVDGLSPIRGLVAAYDYELDDLGLHPVGPELSEEDHVIAIRPGENRFLMELEDFLFRRTTLTRRLLAEAGS